MIRVNSAFAGFTIFVDHPRNPCSVSPVTRQMRQSGMTVAPIFS
jgi:hypothetical protein